MAHFPVRIGLPASWKEVVAMVLASPNPPLTHAGFCSQPATVDIASWICGSVNSTLWLTHWSYPSPPDLRSTTSSSQSVAGQPVAVPELIPPHQGFLPDAAIWADSAIIWSHVVGTWYPAAVNALGAYQPSDFMFADIGAA